MWDTLLTGAMHKGFYSGVVVIGAGGVAADLLWAIKLA